MDVPDSLNERFDLFRSSGRFFKHGAAELFAEESWVQVLLGQGFEAKADPVAQFVPTEEIVGFLNDMAEIIADVAETLPDHGDFISRLPSSTPSAGGGGDVHADAQPRRSASLAASPFAALVS